MNKLLICLICLISILGCKKKNVSEPLSENMLVLVPSLQYKEAKNNDTLSILSRSWKKQSTTLLEAEVAEHYTFRSVNSEVDCSFKDRTIIYTWNLISNSTVLVISPKIGEYYGYQPGGIYENEETNLETQKSVTGSYRILTLSASRMILKKLK